MFHELRAFKPDEPSRTVHDLFDRSLPFAVVASSHGDAKALRDVFDRLKTEGIEQVYHTGDITGECDDPCGCLDLFAETRRGAILGNHDVLCLGTEYVHTYDEKMSRAAVASWEACDFDHKSRMANLPVKIFNQHFAIVHESVQPPFYAKRSKRRRRSHGWDAGSSADENTTAVCYGKIDRPHFIGSDHMAYVLHSDPILKIERPGPGDEMVLPRASVVSVPSVAFSRDERYDCAYVTGVVDGDGRVRITFHSFKPTGRSSRWSFFEE